MRFNLLTLLYIFTLLAAGMGTFGPWLGLSLTGAVLLFWFAVENSRSLGCVAVLVIALVVLALLLLPAVQSARETVNRSWCSNKMKQLTLALHNYENTHGRFPPAYTVDAEGKPMHSWRVLLLPYLEEQALYDEIDLDEPWDGPNNRKLADLIPDIYRCPGCDESSSHAGTPWKLLGRNCTSYFAVVDEETVISPGGGRRFSEIADGSSNTIVLMEAANRHVNWMAPEDLSMNDAVDLLTDPLAMMHVSRNDTLFSIRYRRGFGYVGYADGSVRTTELYTPEGARARLTAAGGEEINDVESGERRFLGEDLVVTKWGHVFSFSLFVFLAVLPSFRRRKQPTRSRGSTTVGEPPARLAISTQSIRRA